MEAEAKREQERKAAEQEQQQQDEKHDDGLSLISQDSVKVGAGPSPRRNSRCRV
jgi:hypothetical protein